MDRDGITVGPVPGDGFRGGEDLAGEDRLTSEKVNELKKILDQSTDNPSRKKP